MTMITEILQIKLKLEQEINSREPNFKFFSRKFQENVVVVLKIPFANNLLFL